MLLFPALLGLSPVGDVVSAVENALAAYSGTTAAPHEYFDHTISVPAEFSGLAPGFVGLYQINVQIPATVRAGDAVPVTITIGGVASNTVTMAIL